MYFFVCLNKNTLTLLLSFNSVINVQIYSFIIQGDAVCDNCIRGKVVQPCGGCSGNAHVDVFEAEGELFSLSRPQEIDGSGRSAYAVTTSRDAIKTVFGVSERV